MQSRHWLRLRFVLPLNLVLPFASLYRVVVGRDVNRSCSVKGPKSSARISGVLLQTHVLFQESEEYFRIQNAIL